jgi:endoglucanase
MKACLSKKVKLLLPALFIFSFFLLLGNQTLGQPGVNKLQLNNSGYFEKRGWNVLVFSNAYGLFGDEKTAGIQMIQHGVRTATNGDVRLNVTPEQWDSIPQLIKRTVNEKDNSIEALLVYPSYQFEYTLIAQAVTNGIKITVKLSKPLPRQLEGIAGFNLEFLPSAYFHKTYMADGKAGEFPLYPSGPNSLNRNGSTEPLPLAKANTLVLAPGDATKRVTINSIKGTLALYDGRNKAQNGWFVVRTLIPANQTGDVISWTISASTLPGWTRQPLISYSQVGYHPSQKKTAVIELDKNDKTIATARLLQLESNGSLVEKYKGAVNKWGDYLRYQYATFDFSGIREPGLYEIEYGNQRTSPFKIGADVYEDAWHPTLDVYFPVAMDHMYVKEAYRVWHGRSHMDDALQAPVNHVHFDLYAQGASTGTPYKPLDHIPGLNIGGWYDAGDFDIRTQTIYSVVSSMVDTWEEFKPLRDETSVNQTTRFVTIHVPDGKPDLLQQIEHGTLQLLAQYKAVGHAINGIVESHLSQYTHLGDASTKTDNLVYNPKLDSFQTDGFTSGAFDDRWAFTTKSTALNYGSIAALAAASRALKGYNDTLASQCLATAKKVWEEEHSHPPDIFIHGNTTGGPLLDEEWKAAVELLITTSNQEYAQRINELLPIIQKQFGRYASLAVRAIPFMPKQYKDKLVPCVLSYKKQLDSVYRDNPYGVPITKGGWAGNGTVINFAITNYYLHKYFPQQITKEDVFSGLNYIYGCHPASDISFVSGVGTRSKEIAYGNNRADFSFIAGGVVPGVLIIPPDYPENKEDWPFFWGENEYVVNVGASYIYLVHAVNTLLHENKNTL